MRAIPSIWLILAAAALALGLSHAPIRWYLRGGLLVGGVVGGFVGIAERDCRNGEDGRSVTARDAQRRWRRNLTAFGLFLLWSVILLLGLRYLQRSALPYFHYSPTEFGRLAPHRSWVLGHITGGMIALLTGPFQFWPGLRARALYVHRWLGRAYLGGVLLAAASAFPLASFIPPEEGGAPTGFSMGILAVAWLATSGAGLLAVVRRDLAAHRNWMIRSYTLTLAFVTIRLQLDIPLVLKLGPESLITPFIVWAAWLLPLGGVEFALQRLRAQRSRHNAQGAEPAVKLAS